MIVPTKHEKLNRTALVVGADIIALAKDSNCALEEIYRNLRYRKKLSLEKFYDVILFLWLVNAIDVRNGILYLRSASDKTL
jgi:hypothetical protein